MLRKRTRASSYLAAGLGLALVATLGACGTGNPNDAAASATPAGTTAGTATDSAAPALSGSVVVWSAWAEGTPMQQKYAQWFADFEAETGVKVQANFMGDEMYTNAQQAIATGDGPDVLSMTTDRSSTIPGLADLSSVLDSTTADGATLRDVIPEQLVEMSNVDGRDVMLPQIMTGYGLWYDAALRTDVAAAPPADWDSFIAYLDEAKAASVAGIALDGTNGNHDSRWFYYPLLRLSGPGSFKALGTTEDGSAWDDPNVLKAAQYTYQLAQGGYFIDGYQGSKPPNAQNAWAVGDAYFLLNGSWIPKETAGQQREGAELMPIRFPAMPDGSFDNLVEVGSLGWSIADNAKNKANAEALLVYLTQQKYQQEIADDVAELPARTDVDAPASLAPFRDWVEEADATTPAFDGATTASAGWWDNVLTPLTSKLVFGQITPEDFVAQGKQGTVDHYAALG